MLIQYYYCDKMYLYFNHTKDFGELYAQFDHENSSNSVKATRTDRRAKSKCRPNPKLLFTAHSDPITFEFFSQIV